jgi:hypothetical protein
MNFWPPMQRGECGTYKEYNPQKPGRVSKFTSNFEICRPIGQSVLTWRTSQKAKQANCRVIWWIFSTTQTVYRVISCSYIFIHSSMDLQPFCWGLASLLQFRNLFTQLVRLLGRVISPSQGLYPNTGQHKDRINAHTNNYTSTRYSCI